MHLFVCVCVTFSRSVARTPALHSLTHSLCVHSSCAEQNIPLLHEGLGQLWHEPEQRAVQCWYNTQHIHNTHTHTHTHTTHNTPQQNTRAQTQTRNNNYTHTTHHFRKVWNFPRPNGASVLLIASVVHTLRVQQHNTHNNTTQHTLQNTLQRNTQCTHRNTITHTRQHTQHTLNTLYTAGRNTLHTHTTHNTQHKTQHNTHLLCQTGT